MLRLGFVLLAFLACAATNGKRLLGLVMIALFLGMFFPAGAAEAARWNHGCPAGWSHWQYEQRSGCCPPGTSYLWFSDQDQGCFNGGLKAPVDPLDKAGVVKKLEIRP